MLPDKVVSSTVQKRAPSASASASTSKKEPAASSKKKATTDPNKQPSFAEQEAALKPAADKKPAQAKNFSFDVTEVRLLGGTKAEADLMCRYTDKDYNAVLTEKITVKFKKRADDFDSGYELFESFMAAGHLAGKLTPAMIDKMYSDLSSKFVMKGAMALRDRAICKGTTGETRKTLDGLESISVTGARSLPGGKAEIKVTLAVSAGGFAQAPKAYTVVFAMAPKGNAQAWVSAHNALEQFVKDGHLKSYTWEDSKDIHNNPLRVGWAQAVSAELEML